MRIGKKLTFSHLSLAVVPSVTLGVIICLIVANKFAELDEVADKQGVQVIKKQAASSEELSATSTQLSKGAEEMTAQSSNVAGATEQMSTNINTMASGAEEMSVNVQGVSSTAEEMSQNMGAVASASRK